MGEPVKVAIVGCGNISDIYLQNLTYFDSTDVVACADLDLEQAQAKAVEYEVPGYGAPEDVYADPSIEIVVNLTTPDAHASVGMQALAAGKSVYNEKPLAITREEAAQMLSLAAQNGLLVGGAPDTFLGTGIQTCQKLIQDGEIGRPIAATAFMLNHGHESWHPNPEFYYKPGGGPMFDMGPYYLTALAVLMGRVRRVTGSTQISFAERTITSKPKFGQSIRVDVPTHVVGVLEFDAGAVATVITSFDVWAHNMPHIEIYGTEGTLSVPDPNRFDGEVRLWQNGSWATIPRIEGYAANSRGVGVADMADALRNGRQHRASGELGLHVLDIMHALHESSAAGQHIELTTAFPMPPLLGERFDS
jgi:predicted dehydrogenase